MRRVRQEAVRERGGGLAFAVRNGVGYWINKVDDIQIVEADRHPELLWNIWKKPENCKHLHTPSMSRWAEHVGRVTEDLERLLRGRDVFQSGNFNAHHPSWDENSEEDALGPMGGPGRDDGRLQPCHPERRKRNTTCKTEWLSGY